MRVAAIGLGWVALLVTGIGCDRLPALGGEGQKCFGNGTCRGELVCDQATDTCRAVQACGGDADCPGGFWCDGGGCRVCDDGGHCGPQCKSCVIDAAGQACLPDPHGDLNCGCESQADCENWKFCNAETHHCNSCEFDDRCGVGCVDCAGDAAGDACLWLDGTYECGCGGDGDCDGEDRCVDHVCQAACAADCTGKCDGGDDGCGGTCSGGCTEAGTYCDAGTCTPCEVASNCGPGCVACSDQSNNKACIDTGAGFACGCLGDGDCQQGETCQADDSCTGQCTANCNGLCGGADDGCGGTCDDDCAVGMYCQDQVCAMCQVPAACGPGCDDCASQSSETDCIYVADVLGFQCGCDGQEDCAQGEDCQAGGCVPAAITPLHALDLTNNDCPVVYVDISDSFTPHFASALLVACGNGGLTERLWFLDGALVPAGPDASWGAPSGVSPGNHTVAFDPTGYDILSAYPGGQWQLRQQDGEDWVAPPTDLDGGTDHAYAAWYSPDGARVLTFQGTGQVAGGTGFILRDDTMAEMSSPIVPNGLLNTAGFTADGSYAVVGHGYYMNQDTGGVAVVEAADGGNLRDGPTGIGVFALAFPVAHVDTQAFATLSVPYGGGSESVTVWDLSAAGEVRVDLQFQVAGASSLAFLPEQGATQAQAVLTGHANGVVAAHWVTGPNAGTRLDPELVVDCGAEPVGRMRLSPTGDVLATVCGSKIHLWSTADLRSLFLSK